MPLKKCKIKILGCGSSMGVPVIGCECNVCKSKNSKNIRTRSSILVQIDDTKILIDTSPDLRQQMIQNNLSSFDFALFTHAHADHILGFDDLRSVYSSLKKPMNIYSNKETIEHIEKVFDYMIMNDSSKEMFPRFIKSNIIEPYKLFSIKNIDIIPYEQIHSAKKSIGYKFGSFAYSTDLNALPPKSVELLKNNTDLIIMDCQEYSKQHKSHQNLLQCIEWANLIKPKKTILTHMSHSMDYEKISKILEEKNKSEGIIVAAYDGMEVEIDINFNKYKPY